MSNREPQIEDYLFFLGIPIGLIALFIAFQIDWPDNPQQWAGGKAPAELFALIFTPLGAVAAVVGLIINARSTRRTLQHSNRALLLATFQKAAELLASKAVSTQIAGVALLDQCSSEDQDSLGEPSVRALRAFVTDSARTDYETAEKALNSAPDKRPTIPPTSLSVSHAIRVLSGMAARAPTVLISGKFVLNSPLLSNITFFDFTLKDLSIRNAIFNNCHFMRATFKNVDLNGRTLARASFSDCDFHETNITLHLDNTNLLVGRDRLDFTNCTADEASRINGVLMSNWLKKAVGEDVEGAGEDAGQ
jgi:hypothetical protein